MDVEAHLCLGHALDRRERGITVEPGTPDEREGEQEIVDGSTAGHGQVHGAGPAVRTGDGHGRATLLVEGERVAADLIGRGTPHHRDLDARRASEAVGDEGREVAGGDEREGGTQLAVRAHAAHDLRLGPGDVLAAAEKPDVTRAHVGDAGERGTAGTGESVDLAGVVHPELADQDLRVVGG